MTALYCRGCGLMIVDDVEKVNGDKIVFCIICNRIAKNEFTGIIK